MLALMNRVRKRKVASQWTDKLGSLADGGVRSKKSLDTGMALHNQSTQTIINPIPVALRLEGPYFTPAKPSGYRTVVCLVAGTGVSGALAIAGAFKELNRQSVSAESALQLGSTAVAQDIPSSNSSVRTSRRWSRRGDIWTRCVVIWTVREDAFIELPEFNSRSCITPRFTELNPF